MFSITSQNLIMQYWKHTNQVLDKMNSKSRAI